MLNNEGKRELAYLIKIDKIEPIEGSDNCEAAYVGGWHVMVRKNSFKAGDLAVYFEIDSHIDTSKPEFAFLERKHGNVKTQKYTFGGKGNFISQGLLMPFSDFEVNGAIPTWLAAINLQIASGAFDLNSDARFLTEALGVTYASAADNIRKAKPVDKYKSMGARHPKLFKTRPIRWLMRYNWGRKLLYIFLGRKKKVNKDWPVGRFPGVAKTDQERVENMPWVLNDKTPFIRTQKCDGSSATYVLERKPFGRYEFYVCSRNVRMLKPTQKCFYEDNYYWDAAIKYDIENKMKDYLKNHKENTFVCWQGELCAPGIQKNPHGLSELHLFLFHMTDSSGRWDIREAAKVWKSYDMEVVPVEEVEYILPDDMEEFKLSADGLYNPSCCEGKWQQRREGFVYYSTKDPTFSFKNVSREYLLSH